ncbi:MAG: HEAT repeat domain-containing protein [Cyanobacteria bacterium SID2]|nr:HEAT repeat domain-containing protein [Cyanobacteria bacterium SID2]MBP0005842.1 HEAT repeat domain-containing protein [Cyanobacteria bacterium SBC]
MDIRQIEAHLSDSKSKQQLKAIAQLREFEAEVAVPLLLSVRQDADFLVRSFVAMGLGKQLTADSFSALLEMVKFDRDSNVRAEAANSLSMFGRVSASHLVQVFIQDENWLVRRSILGALADLNASEELFEVCLSGVVGDDETVRESSIDGFGLLAQTSYQAAALKQLLSRVDDPRVRVRMRVALALRAFDVEEAHLALSRLREDDDHRVVGAALEGSVAN